MPCSLGHNRRAGGTGEPLVSRTEGTEHCVISSRQAHCSQSLSPCRAVLLQLDLVVFRYDSRQTEVIGTMSAWSDDNWMQEFEDSITAPHPRNVPDVGAVPA